LDGLGPRGVPVPNMHHRGKSHEELKAMTDAGEPTASEEIAGQWRSMGSRLEQAGILLQQAVFGSEAGWTGQAADAMRYRLGQVAEWSMSTGERFTTASSAVGDQSAAVGEAKRRMPEPVPYNEGQIIDEALKDGLIGIITLPARMYTQQRKHDAAYDEAVLVVQARDGQLASGAATIPVFAAPPVLSDDGSERPPDGGGSRRPGGRSDGGIGGFSPETGPADGFGSDPVGPRPGTDVNLGPGGAGDSPPTRPDPGLTTPEGRPNVPGPGGIGGGLGQGGGLLGPGVQDVGLGAGFLPGMPGGGFGGDAGSGSGGPGRGAGGAGRGPGGTTGGGPGATAAEAAARGRGAAGARGAAAAGGVPMGAGGRGQGEEDTEHVRPTWLLEDDPDELFGTDEVTAPPVIGGDD